MLKSEKIKDFLNDNNVDAIFIQKDENCRYLSEFTGSDSYLFLTKENKYLITDSRYTEQAESETTNFEIINHKGQIGKVIANIVKSEHISKIGVERNFTYRFYMMFKELMGNVIFSFCSPEVLRIIKTEEEIACVREACRISDVGFEKTIPFIKAGKTEAQLRSILECAMLEEGSEGKSFDTIVASGIRSAMPHGIATEKVINEGEIITFDFGAIYKGYHSDITRTVAIGKVPEKLKKIYNIIFNCVEQVENILKPGLKASYVDEIAREILRKEGMEEYFTHALGHGVGLEVHEPPVLSPRDSSVLQKNTVVTVEPGIYISGLGGVRIEDTTVLTEDGISVLTKYSKKFLTL